jgi:hypothetical protein
MPYFVDDRSYDIRVGLISVHMDLAVIGYIPPDRFTQIRWKEKLHLRSRNDFELPGGLAGRRFGNPRSIFMW